MSAGSLMVLFVCITFHYEIGEEINLDFIVNNKLQMITDTNNVIIFDENQKP